MYKTVNGGIAVDIGHSSWLRLFMFTGWEATLHPIERLQLENSQMIGVISSLVLLPGTHWPGVVIPVMISSMGEVDGWNEFKVVVQTLFFVLYLMGDLNR